MRTAVTGATGFVGGHLLAALRRRGWGAACLVRRREAEAPLREDGWDVVRGHLHDDDALRDLMAGTDVVFHLAGVMAGSGGDLQRVNVDGTARVARAAHRAAVARIVYVSSLSVSGPSQPGRPLGSVGVAAPVSPYGRSKRDAEVAVYESGVPFTIVRPALAYGPGDRGLLRVFRWAWERGSVPVVGNGRQELSLVNGPDLGEALVAAAARPATLGQTYHVAHREVVTQRRLVEAVGAAVGRRVNVVPVPPALAWLALSVSGLVVRRNDVLAGARAAEVMAPAWTCDPSEFEQDARWAATVAVRDGVTQAGAWYAQAGWLRARRR